jgi:hypothetical protein
MSTSRQDSTLTAPTRDRPRRRHELAEIGIRLLDEAHVAWQRAELATEHALRAWHTGPPRTSAERYLLYRVALDREQAAAADLQRLWEIARAGHDALAAASELTNGDPA